MSELAFLDSNVLVRYLIGDPPDQADRAAEIIDQTSRLCITTVSLAEVYFVLNRLYGIPRGRLIDQLIDFLLKENIMPRGVDKEFLIQGLRMCRDSGRVNVADAMIWAEARTAEIEVIYSFDQRFPSDGLEIRG